MTKEKLKELAYLDAVQELSKEEKIELADAILEDDMLKNEYEEIKSFYEIISACKPAEASDRLLNDARNSLMRRVRQEAEEESFGIQLKKLINRFMYKNYRFALSGAVTVVVGIFIGYLMFSSSLNHKQEAPINQNVTAEKTDDGKIKTDDSQSPIVASGNREEETSYADVKPVKSKTKANDASAQNLMIASLVSGSNPGIRLQTVNKISDKVDEKNYKADSKIKQALITALKADVNPAVRKEALNVLTKFPFDNDIRDAFLYVLSADKNAGMRIMAVNALSVLKSKGHEFDDKVKSVLNNKAETDKNSFIRIHAASILKEAE